MLSAVNFSKKDEINSVSATPLQKVKDNVLTVHGAAITERIDENTGEIIKVGIISADEGTFTTISATAIKGLELIIEYMQDIESDDPEAFSLGFRVKVKVQKSNAGRDFITLELE